MKIMRFSRTLLGQTTMYAHLRRGISACFSDGRVSENTTKLIRQLLVLDPNTRLTATQVLDSLRVIIVTWYVWRHTQWIRGRASDPRLREPSFKSCAAVLKPWACFVTLHCSSSLSHINVYLAILSGGYMYEQQSYINCSIQLDDYQRSSDGV